MPPDIPTIMTAYITKYALTKGLLVKRVETTHSFEYVTETYNSIVGYHKPYWHDTEAEALEHAETMRQKKICSLKKQLAKMEALSFKPKGEQDAI